MQPHWCLRHQLLMVGYFRKGAALEAQERYDEVNFLAAIVLTLGLGKPVNSHQICRLVRPTTWLQSTVTTPGPRLGLLTS